METKKLSKSLTDNRFGGWGWSMIFYTMILYFFLRSNYNRWNESDPVCFC